MTSKTAEASVAYRKLKFFRVYCDESNTDGRKRHPVYGAILVALDNLPRCTAACA